MLRHMDLFSLQVRAWWTRRWFLALPRRQLAPHLLELLAGLHLLREQRGLDAVEQSLEPADELRLRDPQLGIARRGVAMNGGASRSSSSRRSGDSDSDSSLTEVSKIAASRSRLASSSGAARTSSSSCLIIEPIRMTFAGCSTDSRSGPPSAGAGRAGHDLGVLDRAAGSANRT